MFEKGSINRPWVVQYKHCRNMIVDSSHCFTEEVAYLKPKTDYVTHRCGDHSSSPIVGDFLSSCKTEGERKRSFHIQLHSHIIFSSVLPPSPPSSPLFPLHLLITFLRFPFPVMYPYLSSILTLPLPSVPSPRTWGCSLDGCVSFQTLFSIGETTCMRLTTGSREKKKKKKFICRK